MPRLSPRVLLCILGTHQVVDALIRHVPEIVQARDEDEITITVDNKAMPQSLSVIAALLCKY